MVKGEKKQGPLTKEQTEAKAAKKAAKKARRAARKAEKAKAPQKEKAPKTVQIKKAPEAVGFRARGYFDVKPLKDSRGVGVRVTGCDFLTSITVPAASPAGTTIWNMALNPTALVGTRLATMAALYEKYRFNRFRVRAVTASATTQSGGYGLAYDRDPSDATPPVGDDGIRQFMAMPKTVLSSEWMTTVLDCPLMSPETCYFTNVVSSGDERLVDQGQLYFFTSAVTGATTSSFLLEIEYDLSMWIPELAASQLTMSANATGQSSVSGSNWNPVSNGRLWNPLVQSLGAAINWASAASKGSVNSLRLGVVPAGSVSDGANMAGVYLPTGLWQIIQAVSGTCGVGVNNRWGIGGLPSPVFQAINAEEQAEFTVANDISDAPASSQQGVDSTPGMCFRSDNVYIPPSGGYVMGGSVGAGVLPQSFSAVAYNPQLYLSITPSHNSASLLALLGKTGKFRRLAAEPARQEADKAEALRIETLERRVCGAPADVAPTRNSLELRVPAGAVTLGTGTTRRVV